MECYNIILNKDIIFNKFYIKFIILKINNNLKKNLIFNKDNIQDKDHLELSKNVKVNLINYIMLLNIQNKINIKLILQNYKQVNN